MKPLPRQRAERGSKMFNYKGMAEGLRGVNACFEDEVLQFTVDDKGTQVHLANIELLKEIPGGMVKADYGAVAAYGYRYRYSKMYDGVEFFCITVKEVSEG